jgi:hypothetical protein
MIPMMSLVGVQLPYPIDTGIDIEQTRAVPRSTRVFRQRLQLHPLLLKPRLQKSRSQHRLL